jgi:ribosome-binding protein aMBF1 (putative translation factor)
MGWTFLTLNRVVDEEILALPPDMQARLLRLGELIEQSGLQTLPRECAATGQGGKMTKLRDLKKRLLKDPEVRREYDALEEEFALAGAVAKARNRAGLSQAELAHRMKTTQSTIARLESGRGRPSTRTLNRFAKATGHRLKISFEPLRGASRPR